MKTTFPRRIDTVFYTHVDGGGLRRRREAHDRDGLYDFAAEGAAVLKRIGLHAPREIGVRRKGGPPAQ